MKHLLLGLRLESKTKEGIIAGLEDTIKEIRGWPKDTMNYGGGIFNEKMGEDEVMVDMCLSYCDEDPSLGVTTGCLYK